MDTNLHILKTFIINQRLSHCPNINIMEKRISKAIIIVRHQKIRRIYIQIHRKKRIIWMNNPIESNILKIRQKREILQAENIYKMKIHLKRPKKRFKVHYFVKRYSNFQKFQFQFCQQIFQKIYKQNPCRNILTNIGNQLITYISTSKKSRKILLKILNQKNQREVRNFYDYTTNVKRNTQYYLNMNKIKQFWNDFQTEEERKIKVNIRKLSKYYLRWVLPKSILTSKKMCSSSRINHLKTRTILLEALSGKK